MLVRYLKFAAALAVFVFLGGMLGLALKQHNPNSNWNEFVGGGCGLVLAGVIMLEGYFERWYRGGDKFIRTAITWAVGGAACWAIVSLTGKQEAGDDAAYNLLISVVGSLAIRLSMLLRSWATKS